MSIVNKVYDFYNNTEYEKGVIAKSVCGRDIVYIFCGDKQGTAILAQYAIHAREHITSLLALEHIKNFDKNAKGYGVYFLPLVNPDGVSLCFEGVNSVPEHMRDYLQLINNGDDFSLYKANAHGVDLNVNFDAKWSSGASNVFFPSSENYVGSRPFSEPETKALRDFTLSVMPDITLSYHTKGEEIYWYFGQKGKARRRDYKTAEIIAKSTGYPLKYAFKSAGGYKDWCIQACGISSYTIEVASDSLTHPIGERHLDDIYSKNKNIFLDLYKGLQDLNE